MGFPQNATDFISVTPNRCSRSFHCAKSSTQLEFQPRSLEIILLRQQLSRVVGKKQSQNKAAGEFIKVQILGWTRNRTSVPRLCQPEPARQSAGVADSQPLKRFNGGR